MSCGVCHRRVESRLCATRCEGSRHLRPLHSTPHLRCAPTISNLDTSLRNESGDGKDCIEITDSSHPLFGRRLEIVSIARGDEATSNVFVKYCENITLRIPIVATSLSNIGDATLPIKISTASVEDFLQLVREYGVCPTISKQAKSG